MKKVAILLLAILIFSCSDDDEKGTVENKGQWAMIFNESVKNDSNPVDKTEKFMFDGERLIQHIIKQRYFEEEISNEVNLSYSDNQVTVTTDYLTLVYTLNSECYASQCVYRFVFTKSYLSIFLLCRRILNRNCREYRRYRIFINITYIRERRYNLYQFQDERP